MSERVKIQVTVNGISYERSVTSRQTAADFLREELRLTGTHLGCEHGVCGACTILLDGTPVRSCILYAPQLDGAQVRTVEGLAEALGQLHPIQQAFIDNGALQCGFCTPGFLITAYALVEGQRELDEDSIRHEIDGNLCRCTSYNEIVHAIKQAAEELRAGQQQ